VPSLSLRRQGKRGEIEQRRFPSTRRSAVTGQVANKKDVGNAADNQQSQPNNSDADTKPRVVPNGLKLRRAEERFIPQSTRAVSFKRLLGRSLAVRPPVLDQQRPSLVITPASPDL
jgi:hypothetical protein